MNDDKKTMLTAVGVMQARSATYLATLRPSEEMEKVIKLMWHLAHLKDCMEGKDAKAKKLPCSA